MTRILVILPLLAATFLAGCGGVWLSPAESDRLDARLEVFSLAEFELGVWAADAADEESQAVMADYWFSQALVELKRIQWLNHNP
jgi:hypothetical protein